MLLSCFAALAASALDELDVEAVGVEKVVFARSQDADDVAVVAAPRLAGLGVVDGYFFFRRFLFRVGGSCLTFLPWRWSVVCCWEGISPTSRMKL